MNYIINVIEFNEDVFIQLVFLIFSINSQSGYGWKNGYGEEDISECCKNYTGRQFIQCIRNEAYTTNEVLINENTTVEATNFYFDNEYANIIKLDIDAGLITHKVKSTLQIPLNKIKNLSLFILIMDPKMQIMTSSPDVVPRVLLTMSLEIDILIYLKVL